MFSNSLLFSQQEVINLGKIETVIELPLTTGNFYDSESVSASNCTNLADFLTKQGYTVMNTGGTGAMSNVSINGYAGFCVKVYIDDVLANNPATGEFDWNQINLESISSIEVQDFPIENQLQFAGAVIKIKTKKIGKNQINVGSKMTSYDSSFADVLQQNLGFQFYTKKSTFRFATEILSAKNEYLTPLNKINLYNRSKLAQTDFGWNMYTKKGQINATGFLGVNQIKALNTGTSYESGVENDINSRLNIKRSYWGENLWHTYGVNYNGVDVEYDVSKIRHDTTLVNSAEVFYNLEIKNSGIKIYNTLVNEWSFTMEAFRPQFQTKFTYENQFAPWLNVFASLGFDGWTCYGTNTWTKFDFDFIPCIKFSFPMGISFSAFKEFILPTFNQLYWNGSGGKGNPNLKNEYGWSALLSWKKWNFLYSSFQTSWYGNKIRWGSDEDGILMPVNTTNAWYLNGVLGSQMKWEYFDYDFRLNFTRAMLPDGNQIMWVPFFTGVLSLNFHYKLLNLNVSGAYTGKRYKENKNDIGYYEPYFLLDVTQSIKPAEFVTIVIKVANILDYRYIYHDGYSAPGRSYTLAVNIAL